MITAGVDSASVDGSSHPDLDWAIRGGGGNFGIVTSLEYRLRPVREVLAGGFAYPVRDARAVIRFFQDFMSTAPDEMQALVYLESARGGSVTVMFVLSATSTPASV
jgi:FAD/FMN-containing dehydrogenase